MEPTVINDTVLLHWPDIHVDRPAAKVGERLFRTQVDVIVNRNQGSYKQLKVKFKTIFREGNRG